MTARYRIKLLSCLGSYSSLVGKQQHFISVQNLPMVRRFTRNCIHNVYNRLATIDMFLIKECLVCSGYREVLYLAMLGTLVRRVIDLTRLVYFWHGMHRITLNTDSWSCSSMLKIPRCIIAVVVVGIVVIVVAVVLLLSLL